MADGTLNSLTAKTPLVATDLIYLVQSPYGAGDDRKVTFANFEASLTVANMLDGASSGTGNIVRVTSATLVTPNLGTPSTLVLTNATGLPVSTGITGLGSNVAAFLATPSSANLAAAITDETGSGALVFATSPTLVTPNLGTPSTLIGTNITGTAAGLTAGAVTGLTLASGSITLSGGHAITITTTGATGITLPTTGTLVNTAVTALTSLATVSTALTGVLRADAGVLSVDADVTDLVAASSTTTAGKIEVATAAEINTGTDATRALSPDTFAGSNFGIRYLTVTVFDYTTDCATGDGKAYVVIPPGFDGMNLVSVHGRAITAGTTGTMDVQIRNVTQTADMLTTKLTWDSTEAGTNTAATPAVIDTNNDDVAAYDLIAIDVDAVQTTAAKGMIITLGFQLP